MNIGMQLRSPATVPVLFLRRTTGAPRKKGTGTVAITFLPMPHQFAPRSQSPFFRLAVHGAESKKRHHAERDEYTLGEPLMQIRDRIKDFRRVKASQLRPHPKNWRTHPPAQHDALRGVLAEIGYAGALLARELPDGTLELIDGHLRAETTPDMEVPVLVLDLDESEAAKLLALHDPLAGMAETNDEVLADVARPGRDRERRGAGDARRDAWPSRNRCPTNEDDAPRRGGRHSRGVSSRDRVPRRGRAAGRLRANDRRRIHVQAADAVVVCQAETDWLLCATGSASAAVPRALLVLHRGKHWQSQWHPTKDKSANSDAVRQCHAHHRH